MGNDSRKAKCRNHTGATVLAVSLCALLFVGCSSKHAPLRGTSDRSEKQIEPSPPDAVFLYALDGPAMAGAGYDLGGDLGIYNPVEKYTVDQLFHDYPILGQVDLTDTPEGKHLAMLVEVQRRRPQGPIAGCFIPRHGLRVIRGNAVIDYVICFECTQFRWYVNGSKRSSGTQFFHEAFFDVFTAPLTMNGIELPPSSLRRDQPEGD